MKTNLFHFGVGRSSWAKAIGAGSVVFSLILLAGCKVGPNYQRPSADVPAAFKEPAAPGQATTTNTPPQGAWWTVFGSPELDQLEIEALHSNQNLRATFARIGEARATARISEADFMPTVMLDPSVQRLHGDPNAFGPPIYPFPPFTENDYKVPFDLSYEVDIWGKIRRSFESATDQAQASIDDYNAVLLMLQADLAQDYFSLRSLDGEHALLNGNVKLRQENLALVQDRFNEGLVPELDLAQARAELTAVQTRQADIQINRARLEHAIAVLAGRPPAGFSIPEKPLDLKLPVIPTGLPSDLLQRRPDIAREERLVAAANAQIGVAKAAFFPVVRLTGDVGVDSTDIANLFTWDSRSWGVGPSVSIPLFEGGRLTANLRKTRAAYDETVDNYRQQVLTAFQDVEDGLSTLRILTVEADAQDRNVAATSETDGLARDRYREGLVNYLQVVAADRDVLESQQAATRLEGQRFVTTVHLIKALGGGWGETKLASSAK